MSGIFGLIAMLGLFFAVLAVPILIIYFMIKFFKDNSKGLKGMYNYKVDRLKEYEKYSETQPHKPIHNTGPVKTETSNNTQSNAESKDELLNQLIKNYNAADERGKENIRKIAEIEAQKTLDRTTNINI